MNGLKTRLRFKLFGAPGATTGENMDCSNDAPSHGNRSSAPGRAPSWCPRPSRVYAAWLILMAAMAYPSPGAGQARDADLGTTATMLNFFPVLRELPAPDFIEAGVRVTYSAGSASQGGAGGGYVEYDILHRDGAQVLCRGTNYGYASATELVPLRAGPLRGYPGLGDFWMHPSVLADAEKHADGPLTVSRLNKALPDGTTTEVVRFQTQTTTGQTVFEFDTRSGVKVYESISQGASSSILRLAGVRALPLPWEVGRAPNWVRPGAKWRHTGSEVTSLAGTSVTTALVVSAEVDSAAAAWGVVTFSATSNGVAVPKWQEVTGAAQLGGANWLPVSALTARFDDARTLIDTDPLTGAELYLSRTADRSIVLEQVMSTTRETRTYHPGLGILDRLQIEQRQLATTTSTELAREGGDAELEMLAMLDPLPESSPEGPQSETGTGSPSEPTPGERSGEGAGEGAGFRPAPLRTGSGCRIGQGGCKCYPAQVARCRLEQHGQRHRGPNQRRKQPQRIQHRWLDPRWITECPCTEAQSDHRPEPNL